MRRVLIYRVGSLGDTVVALPAFHLIARTFPQAERVLLTNFPAHAKAPASAAVLGDSGLVHGYLRYNIGTRRIDELMRLAWQIRRFRPDLLVYLMPVRSPKNVRRDRTFFRMSGVRQFVGLPGPDDLTHHFDGTTGLYEFEASRLARTLAELGDANVRDPANWSLELTAEERDGAAIALGALRESRLIVCGPGTKMQAKDWGQENWRALLGRLHAEYPRHSLALVGAREDVGVAGYAAQEWNGAKVNLCGCLTPRETAAVLENAEVFLGPDSGPMHLAACVGTPCVIAFSAAGLPGVWFPSGRHNQIIYHQTSCYGCRLENCIVEGRRCLTSISVEEMATAACKVISGHA